MGNSASIDISLSKVYKSWFAFRKGKRSSSEILSFQYYLETNLQQLQADLENGRYQHGTYQHFTVHESKSRQIAVASVRDRVVHRLLYDYLASIFDHHFVYDVWSCRPGKGLHKAIVRSELFMQRYRGGWLWRSDIQKMFDSINQDTMKSLLYRKLGDSIAQRLLENVIDSYEHTPGSKQGLPIGNLTSQILSNIYLNEFDRFVLHELKPLGYLRYGDDWLCFAQTEAEMRSIQARATSYLVGELGLTLSKKLNIVRPVYKGISFLGVDLWSNGVRITRDTRKRVRMNISPSGYPSYEALIRAFSNDTTLKRFYWDTIDLL
jgi:hypothetical protein